MNKYEGLRYPSIDQLDKKSSSKYKLIIEAAIRAKQIKYGSKVLIDNPISKKPIGKALEEIYEDKIKIE